MKSRGFTLIELLVVISIIGMLSSIVVASVSKGRYVALDSHTRQSIQKYFDAADLYQQDNTYFPIPPLVGGSRWLCLGPVGTSCSYHLPQFTPNPASAIFNNQISEYVNTSQPPSLSRVNIGGNTGKGAMYLCTAWSASWVANRCLRYMLIWYIYQGNEDTACGPGYVSATTGSGEGPYACIKYSQYVCPGGRLSNSPCP